jgi:hypothetical protein
MLRVAESVIDDANKAVSAGVALYDRGDKRSALEKYRSAIKVWPQNSMAHYELGLTLRSLALEERGDKVPKLGGIEVRENLPAIPEVENCFAQSRRHDPLRVEAYQGSGKDVLARLVAIAACREAWDPIATSGGTLVADEIVVRFSEASQQAGLHELALVARQVVVSRQGRLSRTDHTFIAKSLRALARGAASEAALKFLDNPRIELRALVNPEPE